MAAREARRAFTAAICALALGACGGDGGSGSAAPSPATDAPGSQACDDVMVPGHEAVKLRATGTGCDVAVKVAAAAEGRGRAPYESGGFACEPSEADAGDTDYDCTMGEARIVFRYGTT